MPGLGRDLFSRDYSLRESAIRAAAIAFVLLLHLWLLLFLLRPPLPWSLRRNPGKADDHKLLLELLSRPRHASASTPTAATPPPHHVAHTRIARSSPAVIAPVTAPQTITPAEHSEPIAAPATPYGNARFTQALDDAQSSGLPPIPGANAVSTVPGLVVALPPSLRDRVHAVGRTLYCKNAIFKRRMSDEELLKRGLTRHQMDQAFATYCTP